MNFPTKSVDIVATILEFARLQNNLISSFRQTFPKITDWENLLDSPHSGCFSTQGEEWKFQRHGSGICFKGKKSGKFVDAHFGMSRYPQAFDAWRLCQYFDSVGIEKIYYLSQVFDVRDEDGIEDLLNCLVKNNQIAVALKQRKLYTFTDTINGISASSSGGKVTQYSIPTKEEVEKVK